MARAKFAAPYYLAGKQRQRFHSGEAVKGATTAAAAGYLWHHNQYGRGPRIHLYHGLSAQDHHQALALAVIGGSLYTGYHGARVATLRGREFNKNHQRKQKALSTGDVYYRKVNGKRVKVKKGNRKVVKK